MNTKNQKPVLEGFKNRIDLLEERQKALEAMTGSELLDYIQALATELEAAYEANRQHFSLN